MPAPRGRKRKSGDSVASNDGPAMQETGTMIPTKADSATTHESPSKRRKVGLTLAQKQALVDNLQLEVTERARKLRANCNVHAQSLRTRIEIRINRVPLSLRNVKMGDLLSKHSTEHKQRLAASVGPPVPEKDHPPSIPTTQGSGFPGLVPITQPGRVLSDAASGFDKENGHDSAAENRKRCRAVAAPEGPRNPAQVLSPASSNTRLLPRDRAPPSPVKSMIARPVSPTKTAGASNLLSNMVEKARSTRAAAAVRKATNTSTASSSNGSSAAPARTRRGPAAAAPPAASRTTRRASGTSQSSDGSSSTVVRKTATTRAATKAAPAAPTTKRTVLSTIKKGVRGTGAAKKAASTKSASTATTGTGRILRKRAA